MVLQVEPGLEQYLNILTEEAGISYGDLDKDTEFADLGIDRILARAITEHIAQATRLRLPTDLFERLPNVESFLDHLKQLTQQGGQNCRVAEATSVPYGQETKMTEPGQAPGTLKPHPGKVPPILQLKGNSTPTSKNLFLMPDGSGSSMSYARIPSLGKDWVLYGLNSPYLGAGPSQISIPGLASYWTEIVMRTQPYGPYVLGGWSAGGFYITEVARLLLERGERVESLIIIDSPCRLQYGAPPIKLFQFLADKNIMGDFPKGVPTWLMDHFAGTMAAVERYHPTPVAGVQRVYIIESRDAVFKSEEEAGGSGLDLSANVTKMLLLRKKADSVGGWDRQFPGAQLRWSGMSGNHFTLIHPPHVEMLGSLLREIVDGHTDGLANWSA